MKYLKSYLNKTLTILKGYLVDGFSPEKLSLAIVLGACFGTIPFIGLNTIILLGVALLLRLNIAIIQIFNYAVYPIQIMLYLPFLKLGAFVSGNPHLQMSFHQIRDVFKESWFLAIQELGYLHLWGILVWIFLITPLSFSLYFLIVRMLINYRNGKKNKIIRILSSIHKRTHLKNV